nr:disease resistance protein TAO1-like [Physcomitrium patens]|eukprot:XP_024377908.1 disease resistance protein TAO1-like [Physcomitrella patens]
MRHMYDVSCFVESIQKKDDGFSIICKVLDQLNFHSKPKSLEEAQAMMKDLLMSKKFMLVLDDVKDKSHINDVVLMDVLHSNKGSILIVKTRNNGKSFFFENTNLSRCLSLTSFPNELKNLSSLTTFYLNCCSCLISLPNGFVNLSSLTTLDLSDWSSLTCLPNEVANLSSLIILDLSDFLSLISLPNEILDLSSLATFDLSGCSS